MFHKSVVVDYLFKDMYQSYSRFFNGTMMNEKELLYDFAFGF